ncbi:MAG: hypothetical protein Q9M28_07700 [Mariprofundaceae bacterium]|nr:hypothetical protein [Mariprofundaceae bacterium]
MGFFDTVKKGAAIAGKGAELLDKGMKTVLSKRSDAQLLELDSNNKNVREELQKRGLL